MAIQMNCSFESWNKIQTHLNRCGSPPGGVVSLIPLWFPWCFYVVHDSLLDVPMA